MHFAGLLSVAAKDCQFSAVKVGNDNQSKDYAAEVQCLGKH
jgi:hypothetical protein